MALAWGGEVVKRWTTRAAGGHFVILLPPAVDADFVVVTVRHPLRFAEDDLTGLSRRLPDVPLLLSRQRSERAWH